MIIIQIKINILNIFLFYSNYGKKHIFYSSNIIYKNSLLLMYISNKILSFIS